MELSFRVFKLDINARMIVAAGCYAAAVALRLAFAPGGPLASGESMAIAPGVEAASFILIPIAWLVLGLKPITNKPKDQGLEEWRPVSDAEITRVADAVKSARAANAEMTKKKVRNGALIVGTLIAAGIVINWFRPLAFVLLYFGLFAVPGVFGGRVRIFVPDEIGLKLSGFLTLLNADRPKDIVLTPYLRFDKDEAGLDVPEDIRFMMEPRTKPEDLVGVQFQAAVNNGANGRVPYMYAVVLCRGREGAAYRALQNITARGFLVEPGGDEQYGTVVVRQQTTGTGYHTRDQDCRRLVDVMIEALAAL
jgi:hypothetical protein